MVDYIEIVVAAACLLRLRLLWNALPCLIPRLFFVRGNPSSLLIDSVFLGVLDIWGASSENYWKHNPFSTSQLVKCSDFENLMQLATFGVCVILSLLAVSFSADENVIFAFVT